MARRRRAEAQNLDSLLDTMANVTGILVVLLAVTQISVSDAMKRIRAQVEARPELTAENVARAEQEAATLRGELEPLQVRAQELERRTREGRADLASLRAHIDEAQAQVDAERNTRTDPAALRRSIEVRERRTSALEGELARARADLTALDARLSQIESEPTREAKLPDPRPAPTAARPIICFVRFGRIFSVDFDQLGTALRAGIRDATGRWEPGGIALRLGDRARLVSHFLRVDIGDSRLRWRLIDLGPDVLLAQLDWRRPGMGETVEEIALPGSEFQRELGRLDPQRSYFRFFVWDDSFDTYLAARDTVARAGFSAGWTAWDRHEPYRENLMARGRSTYQRPLVD